MKKKLRGLKRQDIQLDFDLYRVRVPIPGVSGAHLSVVDIWPEGARDTILFLHGYAGILESWERQINHFVRDYRVVAPDLRGHGQSDAPFTRYTMDELVADLHTIVTRLHFPERFVLVAHSFGGSIAVEYANAHPERLSRLVLIATAGEYPLPRFVAALLRTIPVELLRPLWRYRPRWDAELHVMKRMAVNNMRLWQGWNLLRNITTPTLVITGARDRYFPREVFEDVGKMIPNAEIYDVGASKHKVQLERYQAVNRAIERFVAGENVASWRQSAAGDDPWRGRSWLRHYSKETPLTVPVPRRPLTTFLESAAAWYPRQTATVFYGHRQTYQQLNERVNQFAHVLHGLGVAPGDRVMIALPNMPQLIVAYYGALKIGGVVVLPTPDAGPAELLAQIRQTQPRVVVTLTGFSKLAETIAEQPEVAQVVFADLRSVVSRATYQKLLARWMKDADEAEEIALAKQVGLRMATLMRDAPIEPPEVAIAPESLAAIIFTSGTTDEPRGVCLSHANLVANTLQTRHWIPDLQVGKETWLSVLPLLHSYGMTSAMNVPIAVAGTMVLLPLFDVAEVLSHIRDYRPTLFPGVPSMYTAINQAPSVREFGLASIKACISGAAPLPIEVQEAFEKLTRGRLVEGYGLTEASPVTHANPLYGLRKPGSIGVPVPNTEAKIVDMLTGVDLPQGQIGELVVRGPQVMLGYWRADGGYDRANVDEDGWLDTEDVAVMDDDGYFQIISRKKDTIVFGEVSVYPRDVEEVIYEHAKVMEVAVVGVGVADGTTRVKAFVVPRPGTALSPDEILDLCRRRLAPYQVPWEIEFREELPKSFVGKVLRRMLVPER